MIDCVYMLLVEQKTPALCRRLISWHLSREEAEQEAARRTRGSQALPAGSFTATIEKWERSKNSA